MWRTHHNHVLCITILYIYYTLCLLHIEYPSQPHPLHFNPPHFAYSPSPTHWVLLNFDPTLGLCFIHVQWKEPITTPSSKFLIPSISYFSTLIFIELYYVLHLVYFPCSFSSHLLLLARKPTLSEFLSHVQCRPIRIPSSTFLILSISYFSTCKPITTPSSAFLILSITTPSSTFLILSISYFSTLCFTKFYYVLHVFYFPFSFSMYNVENPSQSITTPSSAFLMLSISYFSALSFTTFYTYFISHVPFLCPMRRTHHNHILNISYTLHLPHPQHFLYSPSPIYLHWVLLSFTTPHWVLLCFTLSLFPMSIFYVQCGEPITTPSL